MIRATISRSIASMIFSAQGLQLHVLARMKERMAHFRARGPEVVAVRGGARRGLFGREHLPASCRVSTPTTPMVRPASRAAASRATGRRASCHQDDVLQVEASATAHASPANAAMVHCSRFLPESPWRRGPIAARRNVLASPASCGAQKARLARPPWTNSSETAPCPACVYAISTLSADRVRPSTWSFIASPGIVTPRAYASRGGWTLGLGLGVGLRMEVEASASTNIQPRRTLTLSGTGYTFQSSQPRQRPWEEVPLDFRSSLRLGSPSASPRTRSTSWCTATCWPASTRTRPSGRTSTPGG